MRGAPQSWFSVLICRISARNSISIRGRPPREFDFRRQWRRKPARCHRTSVSGWTIATTLGLMPQDDQLMSEHRILRLKPALGLERRGQHGHNKTDKRDHRANLADSSLNKPG